jgi:UDP:flavonoid glycosyltransferase YjiC (YdhE family)
MNFLLTPVGSAGDNFPFIGLGRELAGRGHRVSVATGGHFEKLVRATGLAFISIGTDEEYRAFLRDPDIWHPRRGFQKIMTGVAEQNGRIYDVVERFVAENASGDVAVIAGTLDFASRTIAEKTGLPVMTVHLQPAIPRTLHELPTMGTVNLSGLPTWLKRFGWWLVDKLMINPGAGPLVQALRDRAGLGPYRSIMGEHIHSPRLTIGLWPTWFAAPQPDWPAYLKLTGFPLFDGADTQPVSAEVEQFLSAGDPPIVFTPGSANIHGRAFFEGGIAATRQLGRRAMLLTKFSEQVPPGLDPKIRHFDFAPLTKILSRCAALVHHGGIGTMSAALAAGVPQVIMPLSHDQPDNAARIKRLGVGDRLMPGKFTGPRLANVLTPLLESIEVKQACAEVARRCATQNALSETADLIESKVLTATHAASSAAL